MIIINKACLVWPRYQLIFFLHWPVILRPYCQNFNFNLRHSCSCLRACNIVCELSTDLKVLYFILRRKCVHVVLCIYLQHLSNLSGFLENGRKVFWILRFSHFRRPVLPQKTLLDWSSLFIKNIIILSKIGPFFFNCCVSFLFVYRHLL